MLSFQDNKWLYHKGMSFTIQELPQGYLDINYMLKTKKLRLSVGQVLTLNILSTNYKYFIDANRGEKKSLETKKN